MTDKPSDTIPDTARILVVDDDPGLLILITKMLERIGPTPMTAETGTGALAQLQQGPVDLLILDMMLPDIDGIQILEQVRNDPRFDDMPILILSAKADPQSINEGLEMGADSYVTKPYLPNTLIDRVRMLMHKNRNSSA